MLKKLKKYRKESKYSCQDMANILGISKVFYWQIENSKRRLLYDQAIKIANVFNTKPDELFYDDIKDKIN